MGHGQFLVHHLVYADAGILAKVLVDVVLDARPFISENAFSQ